MIIIQCLWWFFVLVVGGIFSIELDPECQNLDYNFEGIVTPNQSTCINAAAFEKLVHINITKKGPGALFVDGYDCDNEPIKDLMVKIDGEYLDIKLSLPYAAKKNCNPDDVENVRMMFRSDSESVKFSVTMIREYETNRTSDGIIKKSRNYRNKELRKTIAMITGFKTSGENAGVRKELETILITVLGLALILSIIVIGFCKSSLLRRIAKRKQSEESTSHGYELTFYNQQIPSAKTFLCLYDGDVARSSTIPYDIESVADDSDFADFSDLEDGRNSMNCEVNSHGYELPFYSQLNPLAQNESPPSDNTTVAHDSVPTDYQNLENGRNSMNCEVNSHGYELPFYSQLNPLAQNDSPPADNTTVAHDSVPTDYQNLENGRNSMDCEVNSHGYGLPFYSQQNPLAQNDSPPADNTTVAHDSIPTDFQNLENGRNSMNCEVNSHGYELPFYSQQNPLAQNVVDSYYGDVARASSLLNDIKSCVHDSDYANFSDVDEDDSLPADNTTVTHNSHYADFSDSEDNYIPMAPTVSNDPDYAAFSDLNE